MNKYGVRTTLSEEQVEEIIEASLSLRIIDRDDIEDPETLQNEIEWGYFEEKGGLFGTNNTEINSVLKAVQRDKELNPKLDVYKDKRIKEILEKEI